MDVHCLCSQALCILQERSLPLPRHPYLFYNPQSGVTSRQPLLMPTPRPVEACCAPHCPLYSWGSTCHFVKVRFLLCVCPTSGRLGSTLVICVCLASDKVSDTINEKGKSFNYTINTLSYHLTHDFTWSEMLPIKYNVVL